MRKIPTLYQRDPETNLRYVKNEVHPDCQWVIDDEGTPTYKWDGTCVSIDENGIMSKRREVKEGKPVPDEFRQEGDPDPETGKRVGWVLVDLTDPADKWHLEGLGHLISNQSDDEPWPENAAGTYELIGPKVQGNRHSFDRHYLIRHGFHHDGRRSMCGMVPTGFEQLGEHLHGTVDLDPGFEGFVWHHPDGRMAKIKAKDFPT